MRSTFFVAPTLLAVATIVVAGGGPELVLESSKAAYGPYEPIALTYWVVNTSQVEISVPRLIDSTAGWITFEFASADGKFNAYATGVMAYTEFTMTTLGPGERISSQLLAVTNVYGRLAKSNFAYAGMKMFPFAEPGKYRMRAAYPLDRQRGRTLVSNTVEFTVRSASKAEEEALQFIGGPEALAAAVGADADVKDLPAAIERWEVLVQRYPQSTYTPAIQLNLGRLYFRGTGLGRPDLRLAVKHFRAVASGGAQEFAEDAVFELAEALVKLGRADEASATLRTFLNTFPESPRRNEAVRLRDGLNDGLRTPQDTHSR